MKRLALLVLVVIAIAGCKKSTDAGGGSATTGSSAVGSATAGSAAGTAAGSAAAGSAVGSAGSAAGSAGSAAAPFDDKLELPKQPTRPKDEQARVDAAADALRTALTGAKTAADSAALCKLFDPLGSAMNKLQQVSAPKGVDGQVFSAQRDAVIQLFDGASNFCDNPANVGVDTLQGLMGDVRKQFIALVGLGAK
ncbi:MAG TPA: hypothetical protein VIV58_05755 [Kofleriaceae bacterium]